jgi:2-oxoglutarate dehydrogenase complex dihydrolipoamide succinyltransferase (E2) component
LLRLWLTGERTERRVKMKKMRIRTAERLKDSQNTYAMLTTFNEIDMTELLALRQEYKDAFEKKYGVKLGFMSAFLKASAEALVNAPLVNAVIDGEDIVYRDYVDISVAVASPNGLVVPVLRNVEKLSILEIERGVAALADKARDNKLVAEDSVGGTFTISNGGVFGSMMGTPIINPPQSAILGMHATKPRPVARNGVVEIRPIMYVALTYDHRIIDGREAVTFLVHVKNRSSRIRDECCSACKHTNRRFKSTKRHLFNSSITLTNLLSSSTNCGTLLNSWRSRSSGSKMSCCRSFRVVLNTALVSRRSASWKRSEPSGSSVRRK